MEIKLSKKDNIKNISSRECFEKLSIEVNSQLIDVRTKPEWIYVGVPDLSSINKKVIFVSWQVYPEMGTNKFFENQILESNIKKDNNLYFICRSGNRSNNAAEFLTSRDFSNCFNVIDGFEGKQNHKRQRASIDGWQFNNLPWKQ
mgnify:FL=1